MSFFGLLFCIFAFLGVVHGQRASESATILDNARALDTAINNFFQDQDRYPSLDEFHDSGVFSAYLSAFPVRELKAGGCSTDFEYKNPNPYAYELDVCIPRGSAGRVSGSNVYSNKISE